MWSRSELKKKAKEVLKRSYWKAFLVSLIVGLTYGAVGSGSNIGFDFDNIERHFQNRNFNNMPNQFRGFNGQFGGFNDYDMFGRNHFDMMSIVPYIIIFILVFTFILIGMIGIKIFIGYPVRVGGARYYISADSGVENLDFIGYIFRKDRYLNTVKTMFLRDLFIFLWSLLFFIPGIIKAYSYSMVSYILADNPKIDYKRAIEISKRMTRGNKFSIFVLDLSFIGWYLLGAICFGVGVLFVTPYVHATRMELYLNLRSKALADMVCQPEEFGLVIQNNIEEQNENDF